MIEINCSKFIQRRYVVTFLGFLCSVVMHSQRLNISMAMVAMVNSTSLVQNQRYTNHTDCPIPESSRNTSVTRGGEFSWDPELQGYILSAGFLGYLLTQIPGGILAGMYGAKPILLFGLFVASVCNLLSPVAAVQHPFLLVAVQVVRGMGQGLQQPTMSFLMAKWFPRNERGFLAAFIYCGYALGAFTCSITSGMLCDLDLFGGWPLVFYVFGSLGLFVNVLMALFFVETPSEDPFISKAELHYILQNQENKASTSTPPTPWKPMLLSLSTYILIIALFGQYWMAFYFLSVHPTYMGTILNIPIRENGILSSGPHLSQAVTGFTACCLAFYLGNKNYQVNTVRKGCNTLSTALFTLGTIGVYFSGCDTTLNEVFLFIATASVGFGFGGCLITAVDMSPTYCGVLMGFASTVASLAGFLIPVTVGKLTSEEQTLAQWKKMFLITAAIGGGSGALFHGLGSTDIQPWDPASERDVIMNGSTSKKSTADSRDSAGRL